VLDPLRDDLFEIAAGGLPKCNGAPLRASARDDLSTALVATGFAYDAGVRARQAETVARVIPRVADVRRMGSAALDLAWTAAGRYDAFYERGVSAWDIAAGSMLCEAAGIDVRELHPRDGLPGGVFAAAPAIAGELFELIS
jgi:myo-inositol-1(or 4)-monophosphatase